MCIRDRLSRLERFCSGDLPPLCIPSDTYINQHTLHCASLAAGSAAAVAIAVARGEARCGAAIVRPPGHHAESNTAMGFCFFNNAAVAARAAQVMAMMSCTHKAFPCCFLLPCHVSSTLIHPAAAGAYTHTYTHTHTH